MVCVNLEMNNHFKLQTMKKALLIVGALFTSVTAFAQERLQILCSTCWTKSQ